jgi:thiol:disulfide interchange protein DsbC
MRYPAFLLTPSSNPLAALVRRLRPGALLLAGWLALAGAAQAQAPTPAAGAPVFSDEARKTLLSALGLERIEDERLTPFGWVEFRVGNEIYYADREGRHFFSGQVIDLRNRVNLTAQRLERVNAVNWNELPLKDAIKIVRGNGGGGKRQLAIFEDPNCGYCRVIERNLQQLNDVTIYVFLLPILSADSVEKSKQIACSADPRKAWLDWMLEQKAPASTKTDCAHPIDRNVELGRKLRITGTPALVFADGVRVPGAIAPQEIERRLANAASRAN